MTDVRKKIFVICAILTLTVCICFGSQNSINNSLNLTKNYVSQESIMFRDGHLLIIEGQNLLFVKTLHQDEAGLYYYHASIYGYCPNGHPYTMDGGCLGYNCPYN